MKVSRFLPGDRVDVDDGEKTSLNAGEMLHAMAMQIKYTISSSFCRDEMGEWEGMKEGCRRKGRPKTNRPTELTNEWTVLFGSASFARLS